MEKFKWPMGPIGVRMTSDLLFKHLMQMSEAVLNELISSLLQVDAANISTEITNPISIGDSIDDKTVILDVNLVMNGSTNVDLEMQVIDYGDWPERSVFYTARNYGDLKTGEAYLNVRPSVHVGFLSYTLFPDRPKFYSTNVIMDAEDHHLYTDKFRIGVVDLTRTDLATEDDRKHNVDKWAAFFNAKKWEDMEMLAQTYPIIEEAATHLRKLTEDEKFRQQQEAWEDRQRRVNGLKQLADEANARAEKAEAETKRYRQMLIDNGINPDD